MNVRSGWTMLMGAGLLAAACAAPEDATEVDLDIAPPLTPMEGPLGVNGLDPVDFWKPENQQALRGLGAGALLDADGVLVDTLLLDTAGGRSVLGYAMRCALAAGDAAEAADGAAFEGQVGLAPAWASRGLTTSEQRWVTACLLQHLNGLGANVSIMMVGSHPALDPIPGEDVSSYGVADATAFGNIFLGPTKSYVCANVGLELACGVGLSLHTLQRLCGLSPTCGINVLGLCALSCAYDADGDPSCGLLLGPSYPEAIASRLSHSAFLSLYPVCDLL